MQRKETLKNAGINRRIRPHDLRHAFSTEMIANGADIGTVAKLLGHSTQAMLLKHYQYVLDKQKKAAVKMLPSLQVTYPACDQNNVTKSRGRASFSVNN